MILENTTIFSDEAIAETLNSYEYHHKDYILVLFILLLGFLAWSFYLYNFVSQKKKSESLIKEKDDLAATNIKFENLRYLSIANLGNV